ncbi:MAG: hypothetical protein AABX04_02555 [Nanoarchaeota archaeon]
MNKLYWGSIAAMTGGIIFGVGGIEGSRCTREEYHQNLACPQYLDFDRKGREATSEYLFGIGICGIVIALGGIGLGLEGLENKNKK